MSFDTGYIGAHRWAVEEQGAYDWQCVCGERGRIVSNNKYFVIQEFGRHAHRKLEEAAVALLEDWMPSSLHTNTIQAVIGQLRTQEANDKANLLQLIVNRRYEAAGEDS